MTNEEFTSQIMQAIKYISFFETRAFLAHDELDTPESLLDFRKAEKYWNFIIRFITKHRAQPMNYGFNNVCIGKTNDVDNSLNIVDSNFKEIGE